MKNFKHKILGVIFALVFLITCFPIDNYSFILNKVNAYTPESITISNGDFETTTGSTFPRTASNWTTCTDSTSSSNTIKSGVISTDSDDFKEHYKDYGLEVQIASENEKHSNVYMINANSKNSFRYGIKSSNVTLNKESYYILSFQVRTSINTINSISSSIASVYAVIGDETYEISQINTFNSWNSSYKFLITTSKFADATMNIELWLGDKYNQTSSGAALFDNITLKKYDANDFNTIYSILSPDTEHNKVIDLDVNKSTYDVTNGKLSNPSFESDLAGWTVETNSKNNPSALSYGVCDTTNYSINDTHIANNPLTNNAVNNKKVLFINSNAENGVIFNSEEFIIEKFKAYLIEVYVKTSDFEKNGATISLTPTDNKYSTTSFLNINTFKLTNAITENWIKYSIYAQGTSTNDIKVKLQLGLAGLKDNEVAEGYVFFDDIRISKINNSDFNKATTNDTTKKVNYTNSLLTTFIPNAYFNYTDSNFTGVAPVQPDSWTINNATADNLNGIINTEYNDFNNKTATYYGNLSWGDVNLTPTQGSVDPMQTSNNLLMIYNNTKTYQNYTLTNKVTFQGNTFYKLSIDMKSLTSNAYIKISAGDTILAYREIKNDEIGNWITPTFYVATGYGDKSVNIELGLGTSDKKVIGYAFFDNIEVTTIDKVKFEEVDVDTTKDAQIIDYRTEEFKLISDNYTNEEYLLYQPQTWTTINNSNSAVGVYKGEDFNTLKLISNQGNADLISKYLLSYTLSSDKYYEIVFEVKTSNFENLSNCGATFGFTEITNNKFSSVIETENYAKYKFYINGNDYLTLTPYIELINKDNQDIIQEIELKSIIINEVDEEDVKEAEQLLKNDKDAKILVVSKVAESNKDNTSPKYNFMEEFNWAYIPTFITGLAIILAIIALFTKKAKRNINKKLPKKKQIMAYDRDKTLHPKLIQMEVEKIKKEKLDAIKEKLQEQKDKIDALEAEYKGNSANNGNSNNFKKYAKNRKKLTYEFEKLTNEKEYIESKEFEEETSKKVMNNYDLIEPQDELKENNGENQVDNNSSNEEPKN